MGCSEALNLFLEAMSTAAQSSATMVLPDNGCITVLGYNIRPLLSRNAASGKNKLRFSVIVDAWVYDYFTNFMRIPVLSYDIAFRHDKNAENDQDLSIQSVDGLKVMAIPVEKADGNEESILAATSFFIQQILEKKVPDAAQILKLHHIDPVEIRKPDNVKIQSK